MIWLAVQATKMTLNVITPIRETIRLLKWTKCLNVCGKNDLTTIQLAAHSLPTGRLWAGFLHSAVWSISMRKQSTFTESFSCQWMIKLQQEGPNLTQRSHLLTFKSISWDCHSSQGLQWTFNMDNSALKNANNIHPSWNVYRKNLWQQQSI